MLPQISGELHLWLGAPRACPLGQVFPQAGQANRSRTGSLKGTGSNVLTISHLHDDVPMVRVLGQWFQTQNVTCVPSRTDPVSLSNRTGIQAVDLKDRIKHLSRSIGTAMRVEGGLRAKTEDRMKTTKDSGRKWMWRFLAVLVALQ